MNYACRQVLPVAPMHYAQGRIGSPNLFFSRDPQKNLRKKVLIKGSQIREPLSGTTNLRYANCLKGPHTRETP
jgi:hypothetical protein